ncbi:MAG TPA: LptF/LptG family permease [Cyclobacteriaceae bacterium]
MIKTIDKYILKKMLTTFFFVVIILCTIVCIIDFTEKNDEFIENQNSLEEIMSYYLTFFPYVASLITPITTYIATVYVTTNLAVKSEIIAILASGVSYRRLFFPYLLGAIIIAVLSFYLNGWIIPNANKFRVAFELQYFEGTFYFNERDIHFKVGENEYFYLHNYNNQNETGYNVTIERFDGTQLVEKLHANRINWDTAKNKWLLDNYWIREIDSMNESIASGRKIDSVINILPSDFDNKKNFQQSLTINELNDYIEFQKARSADDVDIFRIEKYIRFMQPFTVIILTFIGVITSSKKLRGGAGFQIALGFLVAFIFIIFFILAQAIAEVGSMNPLLAVWVPNIIFTAVGILLYKLLLK